MSKRSQTVQVRFAIPRSLHRRVRIVAAKTESTLKATITRALVELTDREAGEG